MQVENTYWEHDLSPFLVRFPENPLGLEGIRYYGIAYLLGFLAAWLLLRIYNARGKFAIDSDARSTLMTAIIIGVIAVAALHLTLSHLLRPLKKLTAMAHRIEKRDFSSTVKVPGTQELASVTQAMNGMSERLRSIYNEQLETIEELRRRTLVDDI